MEVINISEGRVVREVTPKNFGPTGELAVSPDLSHFAVYSHNVSAFAKLSDGLWPDFHKPDLMLFATDQTNPELVIPDLKADGAVAHLRNMVLPSLSSDASVCSSRTARSGEGIPNERVTLTLLNMRPIRITLAVAAALAELGVTSWYFVGWSLNRAFQSATQEGGGFRKVVDMAEATVGSTLARGDVRLQPGEAAGEGALA